MRCLDWVIVSLIVLVSSAMFVAAESSNRAGEVSSESGEVLPPAKKQILSFGGNGMIGAEVLSRLIETKEEEYEITLVSRGSWPFDTSKTIKPHVNFIKCDREDGDPFENCPKLLKAVEKTKEYYAVLDFSGYYPQWIEDTVELLQGKVRVYIYVSTDSVYEVSKPSDRPKSMEIDAVRPDDQDDRDELNDMDSYGDEKLECEEILVEQRNEQNGFPYVLLRYGDVVGPRDASHRFVTYYLWTKYHKVEGVPAISVPDENLEASSITFVGDAATSIITTMNTPESWNEAYNIACQETFNVTEAIQSIAKIVTGESLSVKRIGPADDEQMFDPGAMYPSVTRGPIDVSKAMKRLSGFVPTPLEEVLRISCEWYEKEFMTNEESRAEFVDEWADNLFGEEEDLDDERADIKEDVIESVLSAFSNEL